MSLDINLTNVQSKPIVVSEDTIALNDRNYTVIEDAVFTDPTPEEGKGFKVFVRNGTAEIGGISYIVGSLVFRIHYDGSWLNVKIDQTLAQTLEKGNETLGFDILLTELDRIVVGANRAGLSKGTFNTGRGGDKGVSLQCAVEFELNWQAGYLRVITPGGDGTPLLLQTDSEIVYTELVPTTPTYGKSLVTKDYADTKVEKIEGKGLSENDFTNTLKSKLDGIEDEAQVNVNADWNATSGDAQILNKPTIPSAVTNTSDLVNDGEDGVNPFITALDIPTAGQAGTLVREVKNMTGATLTKGTVVFISGANGNKPIVTKALAVSDALSSRTFGLLQSNILNNGVGYCVVIGDLSGLDTSAFTEGAQLYLSGTVAGTFTETKTLAPTHLVYVGKVTRSHPTQGQIEVQIQNGYELDEIHDVAISSVANNQTLVYESATTLWKNKSLTTAEVADSTNKRYVTDAEAVVIGNTSGTNTGDQDLSNLLPKSGGALSGQLTFATPVTLASASNVDLMSAGSNIVYISGTTTINSFGTSAETNLIYVKFLAALTLTYNATSMLLPGPGNMTTAANDEAVFLNLGGGNWKCISYTPYAQTGTGATVRAQNPTITGNPTIGNSTANSTTNLATGATNGTNTKTVNIGTGGLAGTTTNINIGSALSNTSARVFGSLLANNLSNTNTGDETQSTILSKLGWFKTVVTTNYTVTGTTGETITSSTQLPTLSNGSIFKINTLRISKGAVAGSTIRAYLSPNSNNLSGALQILSTGSTIVAGTRLATISRVFEIEGGNIKGLNSATGVINDNGTSTVAGLDSALPAGTLYLIVTVTNALTTETTIQELLDISNF